MDDPVGQQFGIYRILRRCEEKDNDGHALYEAKCVECGCEFIRRLDHYKRRNKSCSHFNNATGTPNLSAIKNGTWSNTRLRHIYSLMLSRCYNVEDKSYRFYGAKGIKVCDEWIKQPFSFEKWALSNGYADGMTIDRINPTQNYQPNNCQWIPLELNSKWKSTTNDIMVNDIIDSGRGWSKRLGFGVNYINTMIRNKGIDYTIEFIEQ